MDFFYKYMIRKMHIVFIIIIFIIFREYINFGAWTHRFSKMEFSQGRLSTEHTKFALIIPVITKFTVVPFTL